MMERDFLEVETPM